MNKHLRKLLNGLADIGKCAIVVVAIFVGTGIVMSPMVLATEYHWAWIFGYVPLLLLWAYVMGDD